MTPNYYKALRRAERQGRSTQFNRHGQPPRWMRRLASRLQWQQSTQAQRDFLGWRSFRDCWLATANQLNRP